MSKAWLAILLVLLAPLTCLAGEPQARPAWLVSFGELESRLGDSGLRLLDARPKVEYDKSHIAGAVWINPKAIEAMAAKPGALNDRAVWEPWIAMLGIGPKTEDLVYDASRQLNAARVWWLLGHLGVEKVGLIDGNFPLWVAEKRPVTTEVPTIAPIPFMVAFRIERHATRDDVLQGLKETGSARVIDARTEAEHTGLKKRSKRGGHIPNACHKEWTTLVDVTAGEKT